MSEHWADEGFGDLVIDKRADGLHILWDSSYDVQLAGPYKTREQAMAARDRVVARRCEAIAKERAAA